MGARLLVVDDDPTIHEILGRVGRRETNLVDCEIVAVSTASRALEHIHAPAPVDLVIVDEDQDPGLGVVFALAEVRPLCPAIVVASDPSAKSAIDALRAGAIDYLVKPLDEDALGAAIVRGLGKHRFAERLRQMQRLETVGALAGDVAHDFNNLLVVITNFAELITEMCHGEPRSPIADAADSITQAGKAAATLTRQLLELSRHRQPTPDDVDLHETVTGIEKFLRSAVGRRNKLVITPATSSCRARVDRGHLEHAVLNLAIHSRDTMPPGSTFSIECQRTHEAVRIIASDTGSALSQVALRHLFDPFFVTDGAMRGSGFGLATARQLIDAAGGTLTVCAGAEGGIAFCIELPAMADE